MKRDRTEAFRFQEHHDLILRRARSPDFLFFPPHLTMCPGGGGSPALF